MVKINSKICKAIEIIEIIEIIVLTVLLAIFAMNSSPFYTNDEIMMRSVTQGTFFGSTDYHLVYIMSALGMVFSLFYKIIPTIPWYDIFFLGVHIGAIIAISYGVSRFIEDKIIGMLAIPCVFGVVLAIDYNFVIYSMFTVVSAMVFGQGLVFLCLLYKNESRVDYLIISVLGFVFSLLIRKQVFFMGLPIAGILFVVFFFLEEKGKRRINVKWVICFLFSTVSLLAVDKVSFLSKEWSDYLDFNSRWADIQDYSGVPVYEFAEDVYRECGLTYNDYVVLSHHDISFVDGYDITTAEKLSRIGKEIAWKNKKQAGHKAVINEFLEGVKDSLYQPVGIMIAVLYVAIILLGIVKKKALPVLGAILVFSYQTCFSLLFIFLGRFPERVSYGLYFMVFIALCSLILCYIDVKFNKRRVLAFGVVPLVLFGIYSYRVQMYKIEVHENEAVENIAMTSALYEYACENEEDILLVTSSVGKYETDRMIFNQYVDRDNVYNLSYWLEKSPVFEEKKAINGIDSFSKALVERENCFLIQDSELDLNWVEDFYSAHEINVEAKIVKTIYYNGGSFNVVDVCKY